MLVSRESSLPPSYELEPIPRLSLVVAYQDVECGKHAQATCAFLEERLGGEFGIVSQMWKFDALAVPALREAAARDAAVADLIFLSCHGTDELPMDVKAWMELWLGCQSSASRSIALLAGVPISSVARRTPGCARISSETRINATESL